MTTALQDRLDSAARLAQNAHDEASYAAHAAHDGDTEEARRFGMKHETLHAAAAKVHHRCQGTGGDGISTVPAGDGTGCF